MKKKRMELKFELNFILDALDKMEKTDFIIKSITKIAFDKFYSMDEHIDAIRYYCFYKSEEDLKNDPCINKYYETILLKDEIPETFIKLTKLENNYGHNIEFLISLILFYFEIKNLFKDDEFEINFDMKIKVRNFFYFCFINENCPYIIYNWVLNIFITIFNSKIFF